MAQPSRFGYLVPLSSRALPMTDPASPSTDAEPLVRVRGLTTVLNGKTTLLKHITGQMTGDAGQVWVDGQEVGGLSRNELFKLREQIGYLFQNS
ncbi:MAG: ABC transporter ATP-binding protein, partial [Lysobacterales bacterium 13-68-4]